MKIAYDYFVTLQKDPTMLDRIADVNDFVDYTYSRVDPLERLKQVSKTLSKNTITEDVVIKELSDLHQARNVTDAKETGDDLIDWFIVVGSDSDRQYDPYTSFDESQFFEKQNQALWSSLNTIAKKNFNKKHTSAWAYAVVDLASQEDSFDDKALVRDAFSVLDRKQYVATAFDAILEKEGRVIVKHPTFFTQTEIEKYYALISKKAQRDMKSKTYVYHQTVFPHLAYLLSTTVSQSGTFVDLRDLDILPVSILLQMYPYVPSDDALKSSAYTKDTKNFFALEIFRRSGLMEDWQTATDYAKLILWPETSSLYDGDEAHQKTSYYQDLLQYFITTQDVPTKKFMYISLATTKREMWRLGNSNAVPDSTTIQHTTPLFFREQNGNTIREEKIKTEISTQESIGKYLVDLDYTTIDEKYRYLIPQTMSDYVMLVTRYSYDDKGKEYSKKVFNRLHKDFPDSIQAENTKFYY
jgi:hypothetical protein